MSDEPRITPWELAFAGPEMAERFTAIREEAEARDVAVDAPERFLFLAAAGALLQDVLPATRLPEAVREEVLEHYGLILYHAFQYWRFGMHSDALDERTARELCATTSTIGRWDVVAPVPAGYLQLPRNLFWARVEEGVPPEPVDGFFWSLIGVEDPAVPPFARLDLLAVLGVRKDRPGFGVLDVAEPLESDAAGHWGDIEARPGGVDFENVLPGGEMRQLLALTTRLELLKLASRWFWTQARNG